MQSRQQPNTFLKTIVQVLKSYVHFLLDVCTVLIIKPTGNNQFLTWGKAYKGETPRFTSQQKLGKVTHLSRNRSLASTDSTFNLEIEPEIRINNSQSPLNYC